MPQEWLIKFLGGYAFMKLCNIHLNKTETTFPVMYVCSDKRRICTVRKFLLSLHLISENCYGNLFPLDEEVEKLLSGYTKEPKFDLTAKNNNLPLNDPTEGYRNLSYFECKEKIHIYLNQKDYDFRVVTSGRTEEKRLTVFKKDIIDTLDNNILTNHIEKYALEHIQEILREAFRIKIQALHNYQFVFTRDDDVLPYDPIVYNNGIGTHFDKDDVLGDKDLSDRIEKVAEYVRFYQRALKELRILKRHCQEMGSDKFREHIINTCLYHLQGLAPMWMNDGNKDHYQLAMMVLKGTSVK